MKVFYVNLNV